MILMMFHAYLKEEANGKISVRWDIPFFWIACKSNLKHKSADAWVTFTAEVSVNIKGGDFESIFITDHSKLFSSNRKKKPFTTERLFMMFW
ncbi:MAG: hypothetical protein CFE24_00015 [Flavobacterium sp. BFFFF2]|nr:MAG: hypothetical protein CFE24_00015 [Flavobacterium sp. BFFFF2]